MHILKGLTKGYIHIGDKIKRNGKVYWKCKCTLCGKEYEERTDILVHSDKGDCGCKGTKATWDKELRYNSKQPSEQYSTQPSTQPVDNLSTTVDKL